jgi:hypothetical protein
MPRPKNAIPSVEKKISIPSDIVARVDLELWSVVEGKVPHGAWSQLLTTLLRAHVESLPPLDPNAPKL